MKFIEQIEKLLVNLGFNRDTVSAIKYKRTVSQIQRDELKTQQFKSVSNFIDCLNRRDYKDKEKEIFSRLDYFKNNIDGKNTNPSHYEATCLVIWNDLRKISTSITFEQEDSNPYILLFSRLMMSSFEDCKSIINEIVDKYPNISMDCLGTIFEVKLDITNELKNILPSYVSKTISSADSEKEVDYVNRLAEKDMYIYEEYNDFVVHVLEMAETIYRLRLFQMLKNKDIAPLYFNILNNKVESGLFISFYYRKYIKIDEQKELIECYNDIIQKNIGVIDLSFEEIINMNPDDIERYASTLFRFGVQIQRESISTSTVVLEQNDEMIIADEMPKKYILK